MKIYTYIKYPVKKDSLDACKLSMFVLCDRIEKSKGFITVYPKSETVIDAKGNQRIIYPKNNTIGFYCKSLSITDIIKFKGGFHVEKCEREERLPLARRWYVLTKQQLPRKLKKKLIGHKAAMKRITDHTNQVKLFGDESAA